MCVATMRGNGNGVHWQWWLCLYVGCVWYIYISGVCVLRVLCVVDMCCVCVVLCVCDVILCVPLCGLCVACDVYVFGVMSVYDEWVVLWCGVLRALCPPIQPHNIPPPHHSICMNHASTSKQQTIGHKTSIGVNAPKHVVNMYQLACVCVSLN